MAYFNDKFQEIKSNLSLYFLNSQSVDSQEFTKYNNKQLLKRLQIVSITLMIVYIYYFIADFFLLTAVDHMSYRQNLMIIHFLSLLISVVYLFFYKKLKLKELRPKTTTMIINTYIALYALLGVATSLNSQFLNGNIDAYIMITIAISVLFHTKPIHLFFIFLFTQILFHVGLSLTSQDGFNHITKQINSTTTVIIALTVSFAFYTYRRNAYYNRIRLKEKEENFKKLFEINPFPLVLTSAVDGRIVKVNNRALEFYGVLKEDLPKYRASDFYKSDEERRPVIEELRRSGHVKNHIIEQKVAEGEYKWVLLNYELIEYANEKCILTGVTDVTDLKKIEAELVQHATTDTLTGIHNRRSGLHLLEELVVESKENQTPFVLCFIDVNNLKQVNDQYGHAEGDYLIKRVCYVIQEYVEEKDIFFRYGGDEFIIVFHNKLLHDVRCIWKEIVDRLSNDQLLSQQPYTISVSHGLTLYHPEQDVTIEEMIENADQAMYREKLESKRGIYPI